MLSAVWVTYELWRSFNLSFEVLNHSVVSAATTPAHPVGDYAVGLEQLTSMSKDQNISALEQYGGASLQHIFWLLKKCWSDLLC